MQYRLIRSSRKTLGLQVKNGELIVRAPQRASVRAIESFILANEPWITKQLKKNESACQALSAISPLTERELNSLAEQAKTVFAQRCAYYAPLIGVTYGRITIRKQKTRWGSCAASGNLNFNCLLLLAPSKVLDSVVVHELCHRKEMNHSARFYQEVLKVFPDYYEAHGWLKNYGTALLARLTSQK